MEEREDMRILRRTGWRTLGERLFRRIDLQTGDLAIVPGSSLAGYTIAGARLKKITKNENLRPFLRSFPCVPFLFYCDRRRKSRRKYSPGTIRMKDDHIRRPKLSAEKEIPTAADTPKRITT